MAEVKEPGSYITPIDTKDSDINIGIFTPDPILPPWVPPDQSNIPNSNDINDVAVSISERTLTISPYDTFVPIIFGEDIVGPILTLIKVLDGYLYLRLVWCIGEINSIVNVELEDGSVPSGTVFTHYLGEATDGVDPTLAGVVAGYADTMAVNYRGEVIRLAYTVAKVPISGLDGFPKFRARLEGLKVYDGRNLFSSTYNLTDDTYWVLYPTRITTQLLNQVGMDGLANHATYLEDDGTSEPTLADAQQQRIDVPHEPGTLITGRAFIRKDLVTSRFPALGLYGGDWANVSSCIVNSSTGDFAVYSEGVWDDETQIVKTQIVSSGGFDWIEVALQTAITEEAGNGTISLFVEPARTSDWSDPKAVMPTLAGSIIVGNMEIYYNQKIENVFGKPYQYHTSVNPRTPYKYYVTPAMHLAHLIVNPIYGLGQYVDTETYKAMVVANREILSDGAGYSEERNAIGLTLKSRKTVTQYIEVLRGYARCRLANRAGNYYFYPDQPKATTFTIDSGDIIAGTLQPAMRDIRKQPNKVRVYFTDRSTFPWEDSLVEVETAEVSSGSLAVVEATYRMNGWFTKPSALRFAYDKINERLRTFAVKFKTLTSFYDKEEGETFELDHPYFDGNQKMRLISKKKIGFGITEIVADKDDDNIYSDEIADNTIVHGDISSQSPFTVQPITNLSLSVETPKYQTSIYYSRIRATWTHTVYPYDFLYKVEIKIDDDLIDSRTVLSNEIVFPIVPENVTISVIVTVLGFAGSESGEVSSSREITGKDFPPSDVPNFLGYHFDGQVFLEWGYAADNAEIWYYEIQYGPASFAWGDSNSEEVVTRIDTRQFVATAIPPGTWDFLIKAVDNAGNFSTNAARISGIEVTTASGAFLLTSGSPDVDTQSNMLLVGDDWVTNTATSWNSTFTLPWNANYTNPFYSYGTGLATSWISESVDVGVLITATWQITSYLEVISGSPTILIQTSDDNTNWDDHTGVLSVIATARYIRVKVTGTASDRYIIKAPFFDILVNVVTIDESFKGTTNASGEAVFDLQQDAVSFESLVASINDLVTDADQVRIAPVETSAPFTQVKVITLDAATPEPSVDISARVRYV